MSAPATAGQGNLKEGRVRWTRKTYGPGQIHYTKDGFAGYAARVARASSVNVRTPLCGMARSGKAKPSLLPSSLLKVAPSRLPLDLQASPLKRSDGWLHSWEGRPSGLGEPTLKRVREWLDAAGIADGPLFRSIAQGDRISTTALTPRSVRHIIKARVEVARLEDRVSGHSLPPVLGCSRGHSDRDSAASRWQSPAMPGHYARP